MIQEIIKSLINAVNNAEIASASYTSGLPKKTVKKGSKGSDVKKLQKFLNWCPKVKAGLKVDGSCGDKTVKAIKKFQKAYGLTIDGIFGAKSKAKAQEIINSYKPTTIWDKAYDWCERVSADNDIHYMKYTKDSKTHTCPFCTKRIIEEGKKFIIKCASKYAGENCIGMTASAWKHGAGIKIKCACDVFTDQIYERMLYKMTKAQALKKAKERLGNDDIKIIINKKGIPQKEWKQGDWCVQFSGKNYVHTFYIPVKGKVFDARGVKDKAKQVLIHSDDGYTCKMIIRYTGKVVL